MFRCSGSPSQRNSHRPHRCWRGDEVRLASAQFGVRPAIRYRSSELATQSRPILRLPAIVLSSAASCLWKSFRRSRTPFRDRPETVRLHRGTGVRLHPGILFEIIPESRSPCPGFPNAGQTLQSQPHWVQAESLIFWISCRWNSETDPPVSPIHDELKTFRRPHAVNGSQIWAAHGQSACTFLRRAEVGPSEGSGFRGVSFHFIVPSSEAVDEVIGNAVAAGGGGVKEAAVAHGDTSGTEAPRTAISGRSRPLHKWSQFGIKKPSLDLGLPARPSLYLLPNSRS